VAKEKERVDFLWRYQPLKSTDDGVLMSYIKGNLLLPSREMILQSLRPYWLPLAYLEKENIDPVILGRLFRNAVYALEKHALYLRDRGGIEYPPTNIGECLFPKYHLREKYLLALRRQTVLCFTVWKA
jgi:hypothetical protein